MWPSLAYNDWKPTLDTLHLWMQIAGKIKLKQNPFINQWWEVAFYPTVHGMTTGRIPYEKKVFTIDFDFIDHNIIVSSNNGKKIICKLKPQTVADFYSEFMQILASLGIKINISTKPSEMA